MIVQIARTPRSQRYAWFRPRVDRLTGYMITKNGEPFFLFKLDYKNGCHVQMIVHKDDVYGMHRFIRRGAAPTTFSYGNGYEYRVIWDGPVLFIKKRTLTTDLSLHVPEGLVDAFMSLVNDVYARMSTIN